MTKATFVKFFYRSYKARPKYPTDLCGNIYIDAGFRVDNVRHTSGYFFLCWIQYQKEILLELLDK